VDFEFVLLGALLPYQVVVSPFCNAPVSPILKIFPATFLKTEEVQAPLQILVCFGISLIN
jgi:hypothetical protein